DLRIEYANEAACRSNHKSREEQLGANLCELFPEARRSGLFDRYKRVGETGVPFDGEVTFRPDPETSEGIIYYELRIWPLGGRLAAFWRDVSERHILQEQQMKLTTALRESEERLRLALDASGLTVWDYDPERRVSRILNLGSNRFGPPDTAYGEHSEITLEQIVDNVHEDDRARVLSAFQEALDGGVSYAAEYRMRDATGQMRWTAAQASVLRDPIGGVGAAGGTGSVRVVGVQSDITERKEAEGREAALKGELLRLLEKQTRVAEAIQHSLLLMPPPDAYPGLTFKALYQSAQDDALIGGDFYDVFAVSEDCVALLVGDATGKGIEAATYTAEVRFAFRALLREHNNDLSRAMALLNDFVARNQHLDPVRIGGSYVALSVAVVDTRTGAVSIVAAGVEPPLILRAATGETEETAAFGALLGVLEGATYSPCETRLDRGDLLAMTSDGITEVRRPPSQGRHEHGAFFGIEGLSAALREEASDPARPLAEVEKAVVERALTWAGGHQHDDICLLMARCGPSTLPEPRPGP
ncbi:MAG: SpoIIE family protein phosphatase, partial [Cytophagales bacterium]|nr:SpoIIE family protein phosphatase [Armatimonadota bacterium]